MARRRSTPWIYRWSRWLIGGVALAGMLVTAYLTIAKITNREVACPTSGCDVVLNSPWATVFGIPLSLFGFVAYTGMLSLAALPLLLREPQQKELRRQAEATTWLLLFLGAIAMASFSGYLMYILATEIKASCSYCIASAVFSVTLLLLTIVGHEWSDRGQLFFNGVIVAVITLVGVFGIYNARLANTDGPGIPVVNTSGPAEMALARHLTQVGAVMYGAYWCSHCHDQKELFGKQAVRELNYVECDPNGAKPQVERCRAKGIQGYPTWEIHDQLYSGTRSLRELSRLSNYKGPMNFKNE
ncbi:MAG: membrane protein [Thermosynechococcus sp.]|uniref:vitamin K epoxide reductase family protein n=1 Tax=Thermosynechococcus sp. TaxID=2814275 RepID=UPI002208956C|nr:vitamin K epoxide reductase family protein [Thermosynechococcus sp.]BCX12729.1 MAG: membrane protein [Thermosynechococcus sp.]